VADDLCARAIAEQRAGDTAEGAVVVTGQAGAVRRLRSRLTTLTRRVDDLSRQRRSGRGRAIQLTLLIVLVIAFAVAGPCSRRG